MNTAWRVRDVDPTTVGRLAGELGLRQVTARCLAGRGIAAADDARSYLQPRLAQLRKPIGLAGLSEAVARLTQAVLSNERIGIFGDYDVDGITTTALMTSYLRLLDVSVVPRVARRDAGYGFGRADVDHFARAGCTLVITGDCGTSDIDAIERARERGMEVIVVDHHTVPSSDTVHPALALINPFREDSTFPFRAMASVGLSFYLMAALRTELRTAGFFAGHVDPDLRDLLDLVALGTVADLVPLRGENRILAATGLSCLALRQRPGLAALMKSARIEPGRIIDEKTIGWRLGPRLNAPGRLGDAEPSLALLLATDDASAARWADELERANQNRRAVQDTVLAEAMAMAEAGDPGPAVVVAGQGWPSGVVGIVAAKLVERFDRPAFVIAVDQASGYGRGSARTTEGVDLYRALDSCAGMLIRFGGHVAAAGLTVHVDQIHALRQGLHAAVAEQQSAAPVATAADVDAEVALGDVDEQLCHELGGLAPFGNGNEEPLLMCRGMRVRVSRRVGEGAHLKLEVEDRHGVIRPGIGFGLGGLDIGPGATIDAAFAPTVNEWRGRREVQLEIRRVSTGDELVC